MLCPGWVRTSILDAERNWPDRLGEAPPPALASEVVLPHVRRALDEGTPPAMVADMVADAVQADRFWIFPNPEFVEVAERRWHGIADGADPSLEVDMPGLPPAAQLVAEVQALFSPPGV